MTKEILESYQQLKHEAKSVYRIWRKLEQEKLSFKSLADDMPKSSNRRTLGDVVAESDERAQEYYNLHLLSLQALAKVERFIYSLPNPLHRNVLRLKYIEGFQWWRVAKELNYHESHIKKIMVEILNKFLDEERCY